MARKKVTAVPGTPAFGKSQQLELARQRARELEAENWRRESELEAERFLNGYGWPEIHRIWKERMEDFAVPPDPLFQDVPIIADTTGYDICADNPHWWRPNAFERKKGEILNQFKLGRVIYPFVDPDYQFSKSVGQTVRHLWNAREDPEMVAAIMIAGSIFLRTGGRRAGRLEDDWPGNNSLTAVKRLANVRWDGNEYRDGWSHVMSDPFPANHNDDYQYGIKSLRGLIQYFAVEHAVSLLSFRLVNIRIIGSEKSKLQLV